MVYNINEKFVLYQINWLLKFDFEWKPQLSNFNLTYLINLWQTASLLIPIALSILLALFILESPTLALSALVPVKTLIYLRQLPKTVFILIIYRYLQDKLN